MAPPPVPRTPGNTSVGNMAPPPVPRTPGRITKELIGWATPQKLLHSDTTATKTDKRVAKCANVFWTFLDGLCYILRPCWGIVISLWRKALLCIIILVFFRVVFIFLGQTIVVLCDVPVIGFACDAPALPAGVGIQTMHGSPTSVLPHSSVGLHHGQTTLLPDIRDKAARFSTSAWDLETLLMKALSTFRRSKSPHAPRMAEIGEEMLKTSRVLAATLPKLQMRTGYVLDDIVIASRLVPDRSTTATVSRALVVHGTSDPHPAPDEGSYAFIQVVQELLKRMHTLIADNEDAYKLAIHLKELAIELFALIEEDREGVDSQQGAMKESTWTWLGGNRGKLLQFANIQRLLDKAGPVVDGVVELSSDLKSTLSTYAAMMTDLMARMDGVLAESPLPLQERWRSAQAAVGRVFENGYAPTPPAWTQWAENKSIGA